MKGDFSRDTFDSKKHYSRVLMQQGRVQTDADWNEQGAQVDYRFETEGTDVIGACGAPLHDPGFHIVASADDLSDEEKKLSGNQNLPKLQAGDFLISAGRFYVAGILCENEEIVPFTNQPDFPGVQPIQQPGLYLVYLEVWRRHLTALDDDYIREKALGGPDTATRVKTVWQVKVLPVKGGAGDPVKCEALRTEAQKLQLQITQLQQQGAPPDEIKKVQAQLDELNQQIAQVCGDAPTCDSDLADWDALVAPSSGMLNAHTTVPPADNVCLIPPSAGYQRLENQLYRVEIHDGGNFPNDPVTFKWSRDNGTVVTSITNISGQDVSVHDVGPDDVLGFANGQWVEVSDDSLELNGLPGELIQIQNVNAATKTITLQSAPVLTFKEELHPKLRRWDGTTALTTNTWLPLEGGIEVQFSDGTYKAGDYWLIPARTATGEIEWPPFETPNANPIAQPPRGIQHHYCRLALLAFDGEKLTVQQDCRDIFPPLTEVPTGQAPPVKAFHVAKINWRNDDWLDADAVNAGLEIGFDAPPDPRAVNSGSFIVTLEPFAKSTATAALDPGIRDIFVMEGIIQVKAGDPMTVVWRPNSTLMKALFSFQDVAAGQEPRVRIRLMGAEFWSVAGDLFLYLDGQAFGEPTVRTNGTPRVDLTWPSGSGAKASDFESWFYLGVQTETKLPLQVTHVKLLSSPFVGFPPSDIDPIHKATQDPVQIGWPLQQALITFNRDLDPASVLSPNITSNSLFVFTGVGAAKQRLPLTDLKVSGNTVQLMLAQPVDAGTLQVAGGVDNSFKPPTTPVIAQDDGTALDGDYKNGPGSDFLLPFSQIAPG